MFHDTITAVDDNRLCTEKSIKMASFAKIIDLVYKSGLLPRPKVHLSIRRLSG